MIVQGLERFFLDHWLELAGFITTGVGIWLTARRNLLCWPITLAADVLYLVVFYRARLLSDSLLQLFFVAFTLYGWWHWWRGVRAEGEVRVVPLSSQNMLLALAAGAAGTIFLGFPARHLNAALPFLDASLASFSLVGSWWQARKHIANWWLWIVVDAVYVGEYIYKDLWLTAVLYGALVALAIVGLQDWRNAPVADQVPA
ncbi:MAG TPA: nicotinamide riboside transporter PnuC [Terracidiphilus sp.]|jgi:nicotinamide mononucleotide transporter